MKIYIRANRYIYEGSIADRFDNILIRDAVFYSSAVSEAKAKSNILSQAKARLKLKQSAYLKLLNDVEELPDFGEEPAPGQDIARCPECGTRLTDGGYCPRCYEYGDEDIKI